MISVLMPSRERPDLAKKAVESFGGNPNFEFIVAIDSDDPTLEEYANVPATIHITRPHGYKNLHLYFNEMLKKSRGDWFMLFNDDARLESSAQALYSAVCAFDPALPYVLNPYNENDNLFPIISKRLYSIIKHYSLSPHVDSWVQFIGEETKIQAHIPNILIKHFREEMNDETYRRSRAAVSTTAPEYNSEGMVALRQVDVNKVRKWIHENY